MTGFEKKSLRDPDELSVYERGESRAVDVGGMALGRSVHEPGWRWSTHVQPIVGGRSCRFHHVGVVLQGRMRVRLDDGTEHEIGADDAVDVPPGHDAWVVGDETVVMIDATGRGWARPPTEGERILTTLLMTDIVASTTRVSAMGDADWRELLHAHYAESVVILDRFRGLRVSTTGDGLLAIFDGAERAVRCAVELCRAGRRQEIELRAGVHTGEVELAGGEVHGLAAHLVTRVMAVAERGGIVASATTRELISAADLRFEDLGEHQLKGIDGPRRLFRLLAGLDRVGAQHGRQ